MAGFGSTLGLLFEINADLTHAVAALDLLQGEIASHLGVSQKQFENFSSAIARAGKDLAYIGAGVGALGGALFAAADRAAHFAEEIGKISERSGASTEQVSTLRFEADRLGSSTDAVTRGLTLFAKNLDIAAQTGKGNAAPAFEALGITIADTAGHTRAVSAVLPEVIAKLGAMEAGAEKTRMTLALFGRGGGELIPVLNALGREGFANVTRQAEALGQVIHEKDVLAAREFTIAKKELHAELQALALRISRDVIPWFEQLLIKLTNAPLLLKEITLGAQKFSAVLLALPTAGASLLAIPLINKQITETTRQMNQAITDSLVKFQAEAQAAKATAEALKETSHAIHGSGLADDIQQFLIPAVTRGMTAVKQFAAAVIDADNAIIQIDREATQQIVEDQEQQAQARRRNAMAEAEGVAQSAATLLTTLGHRKAAAYVEMVMQTAEGIASLARYDFWAAAQHFLSAATFGVIAGQSQGAAGAAGGGAGPAFSAAPATGPMVATTGSPASGPSRSVIIQLPDRPLFRRDEVLQLIQAISWETSQGGAVLVSTYSTQQPRNRA